MKDIFMTHLEDGLAVYCTNCKTHYETNCNAPLSLKWNYCTEERVSYTECRCPLCMEDMKVYQNPNPITNLYDDWPLIKLTYFQKNAELLRSRTTGKMVVINSVEKKKIIFNVVTKRIFFYEKGKLKDISYAQRMADYTWYTQDKKYPELIKLLGLEVPPENGYISLNDIMRVFKFGTMEKSYEAMALLQYFPNNRKMLLLPEEEMLQKLGINKIPKSIRKLINGDKTLFLIYRNFFNTLKIDNTLKILTLFANKTIDPRCANYTAMSAMKDIIKLSKNETDSINKLCKYLIESYGNVMYIQDIMMQVRDITKVIPLDADYDKSNLRTYLFKGTIREVHDRVSNMRRFVCSDNRALPSYSNRNVVVNDVYFVSPKNEIELVQVGSDMGICVGGYGDRVINKDCTIVYAIKGNRPMACIEINDHGEVMQLKGMYNHMPYPQECLAYVLHMGWHHNSYDIKAEEIAVINMNDYKITQGHDVSVPLSYVQTNKFTSFPAGRIYHEEPIYKAIPATWNTVNQPLNLNRARELADFEDNIGF